MAFKTQYHEDSDADDEYERSVMASPHLHTDSEVSPTDSEPASTEHTPTTYGNMGDDGTPRTIITEWTAEECADFAASLGLKQYRASFIENEIVGEALVALKHEELKELGVNSVGHRLTLLKSIYETKIRQDIPIDPDHYVPLSADQSPNEVANQGDIARIVQQIRVRDERLVAVEAELKRVSEDYRRLREELLPMFRLAKDRNQPLPYPTPQSLSNSSPEMHHDNITSPNSNRPDTAGLGMAHASRRAYTGGATPKTTSPTHIPSSIHDGRTFTDNTSLDPSAAAMAASTHLTASMNGGSQPSPSMPSPTSPGHYSQPQTLASRSYNRENGPATSQRLTHDHSEDPQAVPRSNPTPVPSSARQDPPNSASRTEARTTTDSSAPSVEIFKSFRVSMDDPCHKVLPAALKKYNINADWRQYALYIVYGDQERCLGLEERPLILFKQLDKEGRKPMFMLRKHAQPIDGSISSSTYGGGAGTGTTPSSAGFGDRPAQGSIQLPGGVL